MKLILFSLLFCFSAHSEINECGQNWEEWMASGSRCFERRNGVTYESIFVFPEIRLGILKHDDLTDEEFENNWELDKE